MVFGYKIGIFHISCATVLFFFIIEVLELGVDGFHIKNFSESNFNTYCTTGSRTILIESVKSRKQLQNNCNFSQYSMMENGNIRFLNIMLVFFSEAVLQVMAKSDPTKNQFDEEIQAILTLEPQ